MKDELRQKTALFRYGILAPLISETLGPSITKARFFREAAKKTYTDPTGADTTVSAITLERWYYKYQQAGFDGLVPQRRSDTGQPRKLDEDMMEQIKHLKQAYPRLPATLVPEHLFHHLKIPMQTLVFR